MIRTNCPNCQSPNEIPEEYLDCEVTCPACGDDYIAKNDVVEVHIEKKVGVEIPPRQSGWVAFLACVTALNGITAIVCLVMQQWTLGFMALTGAITAMLFSFLVEVFVDIRWALFKALEEKK